jgi:hypothetical protein
VRDLFYPVVDATSSGHGRLASVSSVLRLLSAAPGIHPFVKTVEYLWREAVHQPEQVDALSLHWTSRTEKFKARI